MRFFNQDEAARMSSPGTGSAGRATVEHVEMLHGGMDVNVSRRKVDAVLKGGIARFDGHVLEVTTGDGIRVAARDIVEIGVESPTLRLSYQAGLDRAKTSYWVAPQHETALQRLVDAVATTKGQA